jgi:hypothetical protein
VIEKGKAVIHDVVPLCGLFSIICALKDCDSKARFLAGPIGGGP